MHFGEFNVRLNCYTQGKCLL